MSNAYKPKITAMSAYTTMQVIAQGTRVSVQEMAQTLGFDCPYSWMKAILETV